MVRHTVELDFEENVERLDQIPLGDLENFVHQAKKAGVPSNNPVTVVIDYTRQYAQRLSVDVPDDDDTEQTAV